MDNTIIDSILKMAEECRARGMKVEITAGIASLCAYNPYQIDDEDEEDEDISGL